jgi:hypothetical protein
MKAAREWVSGGSAGFQPARGRSDDAGWKPALQNAVLRKNPEDGPRSALC